MLNVIMLSGIPLAVAAPQMTTPIVLIAFSQIKKVYFFVSARMIQIK